MKDLKIGSEFAILDLKGKDRKKIVKMLKAGKEFNVTIKGKVSSPLGNDDGISVELSVTVSDFEIEEADGP